MLMADGALRKSCGPNSLGSHMQGMDLGENNHPVLDHVLQRPMT